MGQATEKPEIVRRQVMIDFEDLPEMPWRAHAAAELWLKAASIVFPEGERFFIDSVRACQDRATDRVMLDRISRFIHQEAMHRKVHGECNVALAKEYSGGMTMVRGTRWVFRLIECLPRTFRLSMTTAMEHFTAIMAERAFELEDQLRKVQPGAFVDMWLWHAVEEIEHKAVCFDLYRECVGTGLYGYLHRIVGALVATVVFGGGILTCAWFLRRGPHAERERTSANRAIGNDRSRLFEMNSLLLFTTEFIPWRRYAEYYRRSFHPWQHDNAYRVKNWKERYPGFGLSEPGLRKESSS